LARTAEALDILRHTEEAIAQFLGPGHPFIIQAQIYQLQTFIESDQLLEAEEKAQALMVSCRTVPVPFLAILEVRQALGTILFGTSRVSEAAVIFESCWREAAKSLGPEHPKIVSLLLCLAPALAKCGRFEEAMEKLNYCVSSRVNVLGLNHYFIQVYVHLRDRIASRQHFASGMDTLG
jgi:hypothetical protein